MPERARRGGHGRARRTRRPRTTTPAATTAAPTQAAAAPARGPEDRPQTTSWTIAADEISPTDRRIETVRGAGITTTVTFPTRGIFGGQGSVIDLISGEKPARWWWPPRGPVHFASRRTGGFGARFPHALMGVIAYIRQIYLDADHYKLVKEAYAKIPAA